MKQSNYQRAVDDVRYIRSLAAHNADVDETAKTLGIKPERILSAWQRQLAFLYGGMKHP